MANMPPLNKFVLPYESIVTDHVLVRPYQLVGLLEMLKFQAERFVRLMAAFGKISTICENAAKKQPNGELGDSRKILIPRLAQLKEQCDSLGLKLSSLCIESFELSNTEKNITFKAFGTKVDELHNRITDELSLALMLHVPSSHRDAYENSEPFGPQVTKQFSSAAYDIEEASKCLALDRNTACVMHLVRALETPIDAIALGVGVPITAVKAVATWEHLLNMIRDKIVANNKASAPPWMVSKPFFESSTAHLHSVKDAWRNPAMHAEEKYTPEEAERIYSAVKNFMSHLAEHLDEKGAFTP